MSRRTDHSDARLLAPLLALVAVSWGCAPEVAEQSLEFRANVSVEAVKKGSVERLLTTTGTVRARHEASVLLEASGKLSIVSNPETGERLAIGDEVKRGQAIALLAADELRTSSRVSARKSALNMAKSEYASNLKLYQEGLLPGNQLDTFENNVVSARSEYENALLQESKGRIEAPLSGVLTMVLNSADGQFTNSGTAVAEVMDYREVIVDLDLGSGEVMQVQRGQEVRLQNYAAPQVFKGIVQRIAPAIDPASRTFRVEVSVDNPEHRLRPGMFVRAEVIVEASLDTLVVPTAAVLNRQGKWMVYVIEAQRAKEREVEIGLVSDDAVEILSGLSAGDRVVVAGQDTLQDGASVLVKS